MILRIYKMLKRRFLEILRFLGVLVHPKVTIILVSENKMGLVYRVFLPELGASDVVSRELKVNVNENVNILDVNTDIPYLDLPVVKEGDLVKISIRDKDDSDNYSEWSEETSFVARDIIPPRSPLAPAVKLVAEVDDPVEPNPTPTPEPEPTPEVLPEPPPEVDADDSNLL